jgi:hypothetical protein
MDTFAMLTLALLSGTLEGLVSEARGTVKVSVETSHGDEQKP